MHTQNYVDAHITLQYVQCRSVTYIYIEKNLPLSSLGGLSLLANYIHMYIGTIPNF